MKKTFYTIVLLAALGSNSIAQQLPLCSQYFYNRFLYNPSFTGVEEKGSVYLIHRSQWKDVPGAPVTYAITADGPVLKNKIGIGISLFNDQMDIFNRTGIYTSYSYRFKLADDHDLTLGLALGVIDNKIDFSRSNTHDANDPLLYNQNMRKVTMDANFGIGYFWKDLKVGISMPQLLGNKIKYLETNTNVYTTLKRHLIGSISYAVTLSEEYEIEFLPSVMFRYVKGAPFQFDINANFAWKDMVRAGFSYRFGYAIGFNIGTKLNDNLIAGYTYEHVISPLGGYSGGGHEIMLGFTFGGKAIDTEQIDLLNEKIDQTTAKNDSLANVLQQKDAEHTQQIEELQQEIEFIKEDNLGNPNDGTINQDNKEVRQENVNDFVDENGNPVPPGFYIIMGAFKNKDNAINAKQTFASKHPAVVLYKKGELYYVNVLFTENEALALKTAEDLRTEQPDVWVFQLK